MANDELLFVNSTKELKEILNSGNSLLVVAIKGFSAIEKRLEVSLKEALPYASALDLKRITFGLKGEILIAMGYVPPQYKALLKEVNTLRNRYAHDPYALPDETRLHAWNSFLGEVGPEAIPDHLETSEPIYLFRWIFVVIFILMDIAYCSIVLKKAHGEAMSSLLADINKSASGEIGRLFRGSTDDEIKTRVHSLLDDRYPHISERCKQLLMQRESRAI